MIRRFSETKGSRSVRKNTLLKIGKYNHVSSRSAAELLWFYSSMFRMSNLYRKEISKILGLDEKEEEIIAMS